MPIKKSPYSQKTDAPATQTKAFNRTVGLASEHITPEAENQVYQFFNVQLPAIKVPHSQARALRDYIIMQLNNYLTTKLQQPDIAITEHTDSASDISDRDSSSSSPSAETGNISGSPPSVASERDCQQVLCRQLVNLKATVTSRNLGLDNNKIRKHLRQQLPKKIYKNFRNILREQPRTERTCSNVDTTNRMINTIFIMGQETYQPFFNALASCGYHGLFQPDIYPGHNLLKLDPLLNRTNSLPGRFRRHPSQQVSQLSSSLMLSDYPEYHQNVQQPHTQPAVVGPKVIRLSDDSSVVPIRISSKAQSGEFKPPTLPSFKPPATPSRGAPDAGQLTANLMAEVQRREYLLSKTAALRDSGSYPLPPPPLCTYVEDEQNNG